MIRKIFFLFQISVGFGIFAITCCILISLLPFLWLLSISRREKFESLVQIFVRYNFKFVVSYVGYIKLIDIKFTKETDCIDAPIIICNHISMFDIVAVLSYFPNCYTFVKSKFLKNPLLGPIINACGFIPINEHDPSNRTKAFLKALSLIKKGKRFVIFPEGTRTKTGKIKEFQAGIFALPLQSSKDILPIVFSSNEPLFNNISPFRPTRGTVKYTMNVLSPIKTPLVTSKELSREKIKNFRDEVFAKFKIWTEEKYQSPWQERTLYLKHRKTWFAVEKNTSEEICASFYLGKKHPLFKGHFIWLPIFPGVGQIDIARWLLAECLGKKIEILNVKRAKFTAILKPGTSLKMKLGLKGNAVNWLLQSETEVFSKGTFIYDAR